MTDTVETKAARREAYRTSATGVQKRLGHLAMLAFATLVAGSFSLGSMAAQHIGPVALNAARFLIGIVFMGLVVRFVLRQPLPFPKAPWRFLVLGGLMAFYFVTMFVALGMTSPVSTGAVFTLMPLLSAFFGYLFLRQVPRGLVIPSLVLAGLGSVWVIFDGDFEAMRRFDMGEGELIFFVGVIGHAAYASLVRLYNRGEPVFAFTFWTLLATGVLIALYGVGEIAATDWFALPSITWQAIFYLAIFTTAGTFFLLQFAALRLPASKVLAYNYLTPTLIIVFEGLLGHGWASLSVMVGAVVTILGLVILALSPEG
ncbi:DMT family transporter [Nitratireductor aquimarinus]|uniref:DMT family transporter n=1 Tax=Nitratireductor aquimarinus TaxID=889300 RepID=A0ABU4AFQ5_9HYPH|nr:DMT family transporter [Nitratireductor aquimarinus]MDV6225059.1 DMT family transporter [Nitratireductor aquimarinus]